MKDWNEEYQEHLKWRRENGFRGGYIPQKCLKCSDHIDLCHCETGYSICQNEDKPEREYEFCLHKETQITLFDLGL